MKKTFYYFSLVILLTLTYSFSNAKDVSNTLPTPLVQFLMDKGVWSSQFEIESTNESQDLIQFYNLLYSNQAQQSDIIENLFKNNNAESFQTSPIYITKIYVLRWLKENQANARWNNLETAILNKYFEISTALILYANVQEMNPIIANARSLIRSQQIILKDLSETFRNNINDNHNHHSQMHNMLIEKENGRFKTNGVYIDSKSTLAIDISRPVAEGIITLAHEIVHMADPVLEKARQDLSNLTPDVYAKLQTLFPASVQQEDLLRSIMLDVYNESATPEEFDIVQQIREQRISQLKNTIEKSSDANLETDQTIRKWTKAVLTLTLENEFRAYLFSLSVYSQLQDKYHLLPVSKERNNFINELTSRNSNFAKSLSSAMNPFNSENFVSQILRDKNIKLTPETQNAINMSKTVLEFHYLTSTKEIITSINVKYAQLIKLLMENISNVNIDNKSVLPSWTNPGSFDSPINPYLVLTAKISTAWIIRFKSAAENLEKVLASMNEPILLMRAGLLDLHDLNFGELKLLGIQSANATSDILPSSIAEQYKQDLTVNDDQYKKYFQLLQWSPTDFKNRTVIPQAELNKNLYRLRMLKVLNWLDKYFPNAYENLASIRVLQLKLKEGLYDHSEIDDTRAAELQAKLVEAAKYAAFTNTELSKMDYLIKTIGSMYVLAKEDNWDEVAAQYQRKMLSAKTLLENGGYISQFSVGEFQKKFNVELSNLQSTMIKEYSTCTRIDEMQFISSNTKFKFFQYEFPLTTVCYKGKVYSFRQPGDYNRAATTLIKNEIPESRIFIGARPVSLVPFIDTRSSKNSSSRRDISPETSARSMLQPGFSPIPGFRP